MIYKRLFAVFFLFALISLCTNTNAQLAQPNQNDVVTATSGSINYLMPQMMQSTVQSNEHISGTASQWTAGANLPFPKEYHTVASYNGNIYVFAGYDFENNQLSVDRKCYKYNTASNAWSKIADYPLTQFVRGQAQVVNGKIYILAGLASVSPFSISLTIYEYDPATDIYTKKTNIPKSQCHAATAVIDNKIYVIGGQTIASGSLQFTQMVQVYDPATDSWGSATNYPQAVCYLGAATVQNKAVVTGGYNNTLTFFYIKDTYIGEVTGGTLTWTKVSDNPAGPSIMVDGVGLGTKAFFFSGLYGKPSGASLISPFTYSYDVVTKTWKQLEYKPTPIYWTPQAGTDGNVIVAPGGMNTSGNIINTVEIYNPSAAEVSVMRVLYPMPEYFTSQIYKNMTPNSTASVSIRLTNVGVPDLTWSLAVDQTGKNYVSVLPASGTVHQGDTASFSINIDTKNLTSGTNKTSIALTSNDPMQGTVSIPVTLVVIDQVKGATRNVLVEEFTGTWCGWCPYGADALELMIQAHPQNMIVISHHGGSATEPMQTLVGNQVISGINPAIFPSAAFDREYLSVGYQGGIVVDRSQWENAFSLRAQVISPVALNIKNYSYNSSTKKVDFDIDVLNYASTNLPIRVNAIVTQDGSVWNQYKYAADGSSGSWVIGYQHKHVVKQIVPDAFGEIINPVANVIEPQATITKHFSFTSADSLASNANLVLVAHISDGKIFGPVLQSKEIGITGTGLAVRDNGLPQEFSLNNYPNPVGILSQSNTTITFALPTKTHVTLEVFDALGRNVSTLINAEREPGVHYTNFDASNLPAGVYYYALKAGSFTQTKKLLVVK